MSPHHSAARAYSAAYYTATSAYYAADAAYYALAALAAYHAAHYARATTDAAKACAEEE